MEKTWQGVLPVAGTVGARVRLFARFVGVMAELLLTDAECHPASRVCDSAALATALMDPRLRGVPWTGGWPFNTVFWANENRTSGAFFKL